MNLSEMWDTFMKRCINKGVPLLQNVYEIVIRTLNGTFRSGIIRTIHPYWDVIQIWKEFAGMRNGKMCDRAELSKNCQKRAGFMDG